ncbi:MAG: hypothetical protein QGG64_01440, partial [Candidatus Latescibacteria bacterium]|nr:hypothetical protein [Candidatus Latescibacterota bacterium]
MNCDSGFPFSAIIATWQENPSYPQRFSHIQPSRTDRGKSSSSYGGFSAAPIDYKIREPPAQALKAIFFILAFPIAT